MSDITIPEPTAVAPEPTAVPTATPQGPAVTNVYVQQASAPALPPRSVGAAYAFLLLLGVLGAHKFYLGKGGMGVLYIFTVGIFGIGILIDLFTLPSQVRATNARRAVGIA
ncbi:TM2 domain-containing protein [Lacisediminihabitans changchengi]|uniref:TM2 domain-containing protein n=1 Tax=Lacisediminihabitans changchengi TaxID=2787634 RepID=A0A934SQH6_9MICO|nr:TM2 domain-containing protein [Lacisediminihabitans changchengi]MBK4347135.1 TM2 domain-containing protein [Lacisediminihabitans changchengi]